jgi:hypothetical protein
VQLQEPLMAGAAATAAPAPKEVKLPANLRPATYWQLKNYNFEYYFTTDPNAKPVVVIVANLSCVFILTFLFFITNNLHQLSGTHRFLELMWMSFGKMGGGGGMGPNGYLWPTRAILILSGFMKMLAFSLLVNFLGDAIDSRMEALFEGKSRVLEVDFTLILGWNDKVLPLVEQITLANESFGGGPIVIMSEMEKPEMDAYLIDNIDDWRGSKLVTRGGNPINPNDLEFVAAPIAKSVVVLSQGFDPDEADAQAARAVLALTGGMKYPPMGHVVVELRDADNIPVVRLGISDKFTPEEKDRRVLPLVGASLIGRLMVQCSCEPGLARVFDHLLAFEFNEFYFSQWDECTGQKFATACFAFEGAVCIGICTDKPQPVGDSGATSRIFLNPPGDTTIEAGDQLIFIAEDDDTYTYEKRFVTNFGAAPDVQAPPKQPTRTLCIGWRRDMHEMVFEVDKWVMPGSNLTIMAPGTEDEGFTPEGPSLEDREAELADADCTPDKLANIVLNHSVGNPLLRESLQEAELHTFHAVLVLTPEREEVDGISCDSRTMVTMLLARDIQRKADSPGILGQEPVLIAEILDPRTADLVAIAQCNDFMVSNRMISEALAQMSQQIDVHPLVEELFCPDGNEMHIKDIRLYVAPGETCCFWDVLARARTRCEVAIGFYSANFGNELIINPTGDPLTKSDAINWMDGDRLVVISED